MLFEKQVLNMYKGMLHTRCDDTETVFYFSATDFAGLHQEPFAFAASAGHTLQGYIYSYDDPIEGKLIVFDHGFGGGHRAYMKEIELLCRHGYTVLSYDHTGCMESGGESPRGLAQSLCDLNDCLNAIKADARFAGLDISVMGHSWGGFSTLNIAALHPEISHVVVLSGFIAVREQINSFFSGLLKPYRKAVLALEQESNPYFSTFHAVKSLKSSDVKALLIYSDNDPLVKRKQYEVLQAELVEKENVRLMLVKGKEHNPNYTAEALPLLGDFAKKRAKLAKRKNLTAADKAAFVASFDWNAMTEQDTAVWDEIFAHLES